jgi:hypothetical protein
LIGEWVQVTDSDYIQYIHNNSQTYIRIAGTLREVEEEEADTVSETEDVMHQVRRHFASTGPMMNLLTGG